VFLSSIEKNEDFKIWLHKNDKSCYYSECCFCSFEKNATNCRKNWYN
jgi:hypothetical protein